MSAQPPGWQPDGWQPDGYQPGDSESPPTFDGPIPNITRLFGSGPQAYSLGALYFAGATSFAISPAIEAGWSFNTTNGTLTIDTDDADSFGPFTITATNDNGTTDSNAFTVAVVEAELAYVVDLEGLLPTANAPHSLSIQSFQVPAGNVLQIRFTVKDVDGSAADLGGLPRFIVARKPGAQPVIDTDAVGSESTAEIQDGGIMLVTIPDTESDGLAGTYCWEAWIKDSGDRDVQPARGYVDFRRTLRTTASP